MTIPNYLEEPISGLKWRRCAVLTCRNPLGGVPHVVFTEEEAVAAGGTTVTQPIHDLFVVPFDPAGAFPLRDPATGAATGASMTHAELLGVLYSLYLHSAGQRDAAAAAAAAGAP